MEISTFRGEKSVGEIVDNLYVRLTPKERETAEALLLKANPQLRDIESMRRGTILRLPKLPELRAKTNRNLEFPDAQIAQTLADALDRYSERLDLRFKADKETTKTQIALLGSAKLKQALAREPALQALAETARKAVETRAKTVGERQKTLAEAIGQAQAELKTRTG